jgi:hypothetical protein
MSWRRVFQPGWESGVPSLPYISLCGLISVTSSSISTVMYSGIPLGRCVMVLQITTLAQLGKCLQDEWRKFVSPTCPGPRSAHAVVPSTGGGKLFLFGVPMSTCHWLRPPHQILGGEFSSLYQNTFHHYRDFWCFDITGSHRNQNSPVSTLDTGSLSQTIVDHFLIE